MHNRQAINRQLVKRCRLHVPGVASRTATTAVGMMRRCFFKALPLGTSPAAAVPGAGTAASRALFGTGVGSGVCLCGAEGAAAIAAGATSGATAAGEGVGAPGGVAIGVLASGCRSAARACT